MNQVDQITIIEAVDDHPVVVHCRTCEDTQVLSTKEALLWMQLHKGHKTSIRTFTKKEVANGKSCHQSAGPAGG